MKKIIKHLKENWVRHGFETLVVTVGILGAYSLNNWNEIRKERKMEQVILSELRSEILNNQEQLLEVINRHERGLRSIKQLLIYFNDPPHKWVDAELDTIVWSGVIRPLWSYDVQLGYLKSITGSGQINHLQNKELVVLLSQFEDKVKDAVESIQLLKDIWINQMAPIYSKYSRYDFNLLDVPSNFKRDYNGFFNDSQLEFWYRHNGSWTKNELSEYYSVKNDLERMLEIIDNELLRSDE